MLELKNKIINLLSEDARFSPSKIAELLDVKEEAVRAEINELEGSGVIVKYRAVVNKEKLKTSHVEALVEIKVVPMKSGGYDDIADTLVQFDEIKSLFLYSGGFDFGMVVEGKDIRDVAFFVAERLSTIDCIQSTATHFVLKKYKSEGVVLLTKEKYEREFNN